MGILVIDQSPELFWYVSRAIVQDDLPMKHVVNIQEGEETILRELPKIVIMNADDGVAFITKVISKIRNHIFSRDTIFIVFTSKADVEERRAFLVAGAGYVIHRKAGQDPSLKFFQGIIKWLLTFKSPDQNLFQYTPVPFKTDGELTTYGRIGWISSTHILIETNLALGPGQIINFNSQTFIDLNIKETQLECLEKNTVGRYYQYANSLLCKIILRHPATEQKSLTSWIDANHTISKNKSIKIVYFESDPVYRETIRAMIKQDKKYCARGYDNLNDFLEALQYQLPQLILVNRALIQKEKTKFDAIKPFLKTHFSYCVTYATDEILDVGEFKKNYSFAMHTHDPVDISLLESMILKLDQKKPQTPEVEESKKIYFNKHSVFSRITLHSHCLITELGETGIGIHLPYVMSNYCGLEISTQTFSVAHLSQTQFFRTFFSKIPLDRSRPVYHRCLFVGHNQADTNAVNENMELITKFGYDRWLIGDTKEIAKKNEKKPN